ncbi:MAG: FAD-dependent oxidoreductase [Acidobacteriota bacterium]
MSNGSTDYDVVIVGAGVAGCYTAYRLTQTQASDVPADSPLYPFFQNGNTPKIGLFEYSGRPGGRLCSSPLEGAPDVFAEFGGYRYFEQMYIVYDTAAHFGLDSDLIDFPVTEPNNVTYVRDTRIRQEALATSENIAKGVADGTIPYKLPADQQLTSDELQTMVISQVIPNFTELKDTYQAALADGHGVSEAANAYETAKVNATFEGRPFAQWSYWELISRVLDYETVMFLEDTGGYNSLASSGNAYYAFDELFYFADNAQYKRLAHGYAQIPHKLFHGANADDHFSWHANQQLVKFEQNDGTWNLTFYGRSPGTDYTGPQALANGENLSQVTCSVLILALANGGLTLCDTSTDFFAHKNVQTILNGVGDIPAFKINMVYAEPWWQQADVYVGRQTTNLPPRQLYYWGAQKNDSGDEVSWVLNGTYTNGEAVTFWKGTQDYTSDPYTPPAGTPMPPAPYDQPTPSQAGQHPGAPAKHAHARPCSQSMVDLAQQYLSELFGVDNPPYPSYAHFQDWSKNPFGAGWHVFSTSPDQAFAPNSGSEVPTPPDLIVLSRQPIPDQNVFIVGEAWSNVQGWVWGALNSAEAMLQDNLGLPLAPWLEANKGAIWLGPRKGDSYVNVP